MTVKQQIKHGTIQNVCQLHDGISHSIGLCHTVNFTLLLPPVNFTKKLQNERKEGFFIYGYFSVPTYMKEGRKSDLQTQLNFQIHVSINKPHRQSSGITIFLCKYYIVISDTLVGFFFDVLFLLLAVIFLEVYEKPRRNKD